MAMNNTTNNNSLFDLNENVDATPIDMIDETITSKEVWYDLKKYKAEIGSFVKQKKIDLYRTSKMRSLYEQLYKSVYSGTIQGDKERYPHTQEMFKVYKASLIESSLSGYSALVEISGEDGNSTLKIPELKKVMTKQFKGMSLIEKLSGATLDDWILKGEAVGFIKLKRDKEEYRIKETLVDQESGEPVIRFTMKQAVSYDHLDIERIDPFDFFVDALDYERDPRGCAKIVRSYISAKELLSSDAYPLLSKEDIEGIVSSSGRNGQTYTGFMGSITGTDGISTSQTAAKRIEVLTYYGDYVTSDNKVLRNIKVVLVGNCVADIKYRDVNTNCIIYAAYKVDDDTHRGVAPIASAEVVNNLTQRVVDLFIQNLDDVCNPMMIYQKGSLSKQDAVNARSKRQLEVNNIGDRSIDWWSPPQASPQGIQLLEMILGQNKNVLGLNNYLAGDTTGVVRTARESSILFQKANARMRVETDVFNYNFMLRLFAAFYAFNRELALAADMPLDPIYADPELKVSISTNASRADKEGELNKLLEILGMPIGQMLFSNFTPDQTLIAIRYLMAKAELSDMDNLLQLYDTQGNPTEIVDEENNSQPPQQQGIGSQPSIPPELLQQMMNNPQGGQQMPPMM